MDMVPWEIAIQLIVVAKLATITIVRVIRTGITISANPQPGLFTVGRDVVSYNGTWIRLCNSEGSICLSIEPAYAGVVKDDASSHIILTIPNDRVVCYLIDPVPKPDTCPVILVDHIIRDAAGGMSHINAAAQVTPPIVMDLILSDSQKRATQGSVEGIQLACVNSSPIGMIADVVFGNLKLTIFLEGNATPDIIMDIILGNGNLPRDLAAYEDSAPLVVPDVISLNEKCALNRPCAASKVDPCALIVMDLITICQGATNGDILVHATAIDGDTSQATIVDRVALNGR
jgi:hypothetical protein